MTPSTDHARSERLRIAALENAIASGEMEGFVYTPAMRDLLDRSSRGLVSDVSRSPARTTPRETGLRYDERASGATVYAYVGGNPLSYTDSLGLINLVGQVSGTAIVGSIGGTGGVGVYITLTLEFSAQPAQQSLEVMAVSANKLGWSQVTKAIYKD